MNNSPIPWKPYREPWMPGYLIKDANGTVVASTESQKPGKGRIKDPDLELAHVNAQLICEAVNFYKAAKA